MNIGELNRRIEVLEFQEDRDDFGGVVGEWVIIGRVWANIIPKNNGETLTNQQVKSNQTVKITVRFYAGLSTKHRIKYLDKLYEIVGIIDKETFHRWTEINAK